MSEMTTHLENLRQNMVKLVLVLLLFSCSTTYEEPPVEPTDWEKCEPFLTHDAEAWSTCMAIV